MGCGSSPRRRRPDRGRGKRGAVLEGQVGRCFPERSIDFVLEAAGLGVHDIDLVASGCWKGVDAIETAPRLAEDVADQVARSADPALTGRIVADRLRVSERRDREFRDEFMERVARRGIGEDRIRFYDHHYTHAVSAWSPSGLDDALVLTADGRGDGRSVTLWRATEQGLELLDMATELVSQGAPSLICPQIIEGQPPERVSLVGAGDTLAVIRLMAPVVPVGTGGLVVPVRLSEPADSLRGCFVFNVFFFGCTQHRGLPLIADLDGPAYEYTIWEACRARPATGLVFRMALNPAVAGRY